MLGKTKIFAALSALILCATSPGHAENAFRIDGYAAMVNDRVITIGDVLAFIQPIEQQLRYTYEGEELDEKLRTAFTKGREALIEKALVLEEFESREGQLPERLVDDQVNKLIHERFGNDRAAFLEALADERMTLQEWREQVKEQLIVMLMQRQEVFDRVAVAPSAVREAYEARLESYRQPAQVKLRMIVLNKGETPADAAVKREEAESILSKLKKGADFGELAKSSSEGSKASRGGDWGWTDPSGLREELVGAVAALQPGEVSGVVEAGESFYIVKIEGRKAESVTPFGEAKEELEEEIRRDEEQRVHEAWMRRLKDKFYVKIIVSEND
jgi:parvulin-like peptidyl-prolyl isomerase